MIPVPSQLQRIAEEIDGWLDLKCPERALDRIAALLTKAGGRLPGLAMRVRAYIGLGRHAEALADIAELREVPEVQDWLDLCEAWCRKRSDDLRGAIRCMEQLIGRSPRSDIGHYNLSCYLALAGERDRAIEEITIACGIAEEMREIARDEPDLDTLRADPRFRALIKSRKADSGGD